MIDPQFADVGPFGTSAHFFAPPRPVSMGGMSDKHSDFHGLHVAAFESRRADEIARLIERHGGIPHVSPSMREAPLEDSRSAVDFAHRLITGEVDIAIFLTGVGFQELLAIVQRHVDRQRYLDALSDIVTIARGPKPTAAMKEVGLTPTFRVPEPNTWRQVLETIDESVPVANQAVALQEYGKTNPSLIAGLEARGARVIRVQVYRWDLPEDREPLERNVRDLAAGRLDVLLFTSAPQVANLMRVAEDLGLTDRVRRVWPKVSWPRWDRRPARRCATPIFPSTSSPKTPRWARW